MAQAMRIAQHLLLIAAISLLGWLSVQWQARWDFSYGRRASLSAATLDTLQALSGPVTVTSYARPEGPLRGTIAAFVGRYRQHKPDLSLTFVDPDRDPGAMRQRGISLDGEIEITYGERSQRITALTETEFTQALARLARGRERWIAVLSGHGERNPEGAANHDLSRFSAALTDAGIRVLRFDPGSQPALPDNADLLWIAGPRVALPPAVSAAVVDWVDRGGALLWLTEPGVDEGLFALSTALGVRVLPGMVVDAAAQGLGIGDPGYAAISRFPDHPITRDFDLTVLLPQAAALAAGGVPSFAVAPLLRTSERSWTESGLVEGEIRHDPDAGEIPGPLDVGLALTRLSPRPDRAEQRVVVIGDGDFLSNRFLGNGGNRALGVRVVNWLLADDVLLPIQPAQAPDRELHLSPRAMAWIGLGWLPVAPTALLMIGAFITWRRRRP